MIENHTSLFDIEMPQINRTIKGVNKQPFSWEEPATPNKKLHVILKPTSSAYKDIELKFSPDIVNYKERIVLEPISKKSAERKYAKYTISIEGFTKFIKFEQSNKGEAMKETKEKKDIKADMGKVKE